MVTSEFEPILYWGNIKVVSYLLTTIIVIYCRQLDRRDDVGGISRLDLVYTHWVYDVHLVKDTWMASEYFKVKYMREAVGGLGCGRVEVGDVK